ncbi:MAG: hypothetical protein PW792_06185 [Acidobacteriaceae bacterium]|nr:hypothetical protein [Acidobacteriaceae bacterium]
MNRTARLLLAAGLVAGTAVTASAHAQDQSAPQSKLYERLSHLDFGLYGIGQFNSSVTGVVTPSGASTAGTTLTEKAGNTVGLLANFRYTKKPYVGIEFNYTYARYTETLTDQTGASVAPGQIQTGVDEASFGYVITPPHQFFGLQPFVSVGAGSTRFRPTRGGGQSAPTQWRATYYYNLGVQKEFGDSHFGVRAAWRQAFFKAPDFLLNYLTINKHTTTYEPTAGFYVRF